MAMAMASISVSLCVLLVLGVAAAALRALAQLEVELMDLAPSASPFSALLRLSAAMLWGWTLYCSYSDTTGLAITHRGRTVHVRHLGRFITFTLWCNCVLALYWISSTIAALISLGGLQVPVVLQRCSLLLWQICGPLSWLVSMVVTFVLLPAAYVNEPAKVDVMLGWRPQVLHNGYILFCALELVISRPPMIAELFPLMILFGLCYITFAWALYMRLGIYVYFFLDPTFAFAPVAYVLLLAATTAFFALSTWMTGHLATTNYPIASSLLVLLAALCTCTFRKRPESATKPKA